MNNKSCEYYEECRTREYTDLCSTYENKFKCPKWSIRRKSELIAKLNKDIIEDRERLCIDIKNEK